MIHRDLKPQNVLIDGAENAYISDFGLAKSLGEGTGVAMLQISERSRVAPSTEYEFPLVAHLGR